jgi:hypothetical protein
MLSETAQNQFIDYAAEMSVFAAEGRADLRRSACCRAASDADGGPSACADGGSRLDIEFVE